MSLLWLEPFVFSKTENRFSHIYIYGDTTFSEICGHECFDVLKIKSVKLSLSGDPLSTMGSRYESLFKHRLLKKKNSLPSLLSRNFFSFGVSAAAVSLCASLSIFDCPLFPCNCTLISAHVVPCCIFMDSFLPL